MKKYFSGLLAAAFVFAGISVFGAELTDSEWQAMKEAAKNRKRKIIIDNDLDDFNARIKGAEPTLAEVMARRTSYMHKYPVDTITLNVNGSTFQSHVPSKYGFFDEFFPGETMTSLLVRKYNTDVMKVQLEYGKKHGIEIFAGFRINDTHDEAHSPEKPYPYFSKYKQDNPHLLCGWYDKRTRYVTWSSYDFAHKEVRDRFVNMVTEIAENYEIDGIFIDLYRWLGLFKTVTTGKEATAEERQMFSDMLIQIRQNLEKIGRKRQKPILFSIRVPDSVGYSRGIGFDWEYLMQKGVFDIVMVADNHHLTNWEKSIELCHKYNVKCYPSISMPLFVNLPRLSRHDPKSYIAREAGAWAAGADGLFFYNVFGEGIVKKVVFAEEDIRKKDKRYHITGMVHWRPTHNLATGEKYNELPELSPITPKVLPAGTSRTFKLEFGDDLKKLRSEGLPVRAEATLIADALPDSIEISSNNVKWKYKGSSQDNHFYTVPDEALHPGCNEVIFRSVVNSNKLIRKVIMSGRELLRGENQIPWRRIFRGNKNNPDFEKIVDNAYCFNDNGEGFVNFVYPLDESDKKLEVNFDLKAENTDSPLGASMRIALRNRVEIITFGNNSVGLHYANVKVPFNTSEFHNYTVKFNAMRNIVEVYADGKKIINAVKLTRSSAKTALQGMVVALAEAENQSMIIGSNDDNGKGKSYWRNVAVVRSAGASVLKDMAVDVYLTPPPSAEEMNSWDFEKNNVNMLSPGIYPYKDYKFIVEAEIDLKKAPVDIYVSNGGMMTNFKVNPDGIIFKGGVPAMPLGNMEKPCKIRMELEEMAGRVFVGESFTDVPLYNVSGQLKTNPAVIKANNDTDGLIRNAGIYVAGDSEAAKALRVRMIAPADVVAAAKKTLLLQAPPPSNGEKIAEFSGADLMDKSVFTNNYQPALLNVEGESIRINNGSSGKDNYASFAAVDKDMLAFDGAILMKFKLKMLKCQPENSGAVYVGLAMGKEKVRNSAFFFAPGKIVLAGYGTFRVNTLKLNTEHEIIVRFDSRTGENTFWVDGKMVGSQEKIVDYNKGNFFNIGDGSGSVAGEIILEKVEIFKLN